MKKRLLKLLRLSILLISLCGNIIAQGQNKVNAVDGGSVSSAHPIATQAGLEILEKGGTAFDAAIAVAAALNVVEPMMSGIGGYGTILIYDSKAKQVRFLNCSGRFPEKTNTDLMREPTPDFMKNRFGPKSISTPGNLNAWAAMHEQYGTLPWSDLFQPAIHAAEDGFILSNLAAGFISTSFPDFSPYARSIFGKKKTPLKGGEKLVQIDLANTFRKIATEGVDVFYSGEIARLIDKKMKETGSFLSIADLKNNKAEWYDPIKMNYKGYEVFTASLPANSFPAFVNLGLMNQVATEKLKHNSPEYLHLFAEMTKQSYKARLAYSFDPEIRKAPIDSILSESVLKAMVQSFDRNKASVFVPPFDVESKNTTHFVVIDGWGNIVSATQTLGNQFGSRILVDGTGICLNNSMAYSTFEPKGNPMDAFAGRHKLSGDCPVIILQHGLPWAALGSPGGHTITQNIPQIIFNLIDFDMTMQEAIDAPKITFVEPNRIRVDNDLPEAVVQSLRGKGHEVVRGSIGNAHGIRILRDGTGKITGFDVGTDKRVSYLIDR
ncbi:MAG TPA: gamma-glutamyltransferase [Cyclobacteriaceae bacterium]